VSNGGPNTFDAVSMAAAGGALALDDLHLDMYEGQILVLLGASRIMLGSASKL